MIDNKQYIRTQTQDSPRLRKATNPKRLERTKYSGYLDCEGNIPDSGFFNVDGMLRQRMKDRGGAADSQKRHSSCPESVPTSSLLEDTKYAKYLAGLAACEDSGFFNLDGRFKAAKVR